MKPFTLTSSDYEAIYDCSILPDKEHEDGASKAMRSFFIFVKNFHQSITLSDFQSIVEKRDFEKIPSVQINNLKDFYLWPKANYYNTQRNLYKHFLTKDWDISEYFRPLACVHNLAEPMHSARYSFASMYAKGIKSGVFTNKSKDDLLNLYDYLTRKEHGTNEPPYLYLLKQVIELDNFGDDIFKRLERVINTNEPHSSLNELLRKIEFSSVNEAKYPKLKNKLKFLNNFEFATEGFFFDVSYDREKMAKKFAVSSNTIVDYFKKIENAFKSEGNQSLLKDFRNQSTKEVIGVTAFFANEADKAQWKLFYADMMKCVFEHKFEMPIRDIIEKVRLFHDLDKGLSTEKQIEKKLKL